MRITMLTMGSTGDVRPYMLLGRELASRGHQVTVGTFSVFRRMIEDAGLRFFPLSGNAEKMMASIMDPDASVLTYLPRLEKSLKAVLPDLLADLSAACDGADALVCSFFGSVYYSLAEKYDIPCVQTQFSPMDPTRVQPISSIANQHLGALLNETTYRLGYLMISTVEKRYLTSWRKAIGVSARQIRSLPDYHVGSHPIPVVYAVSPLLMPRPKDWDDRIHMSGFWFDESPVTWQPPAELEAFLSRWKEPPLYIGFGSMTGRGMNQLMTLVLRALHASRIPAVVNLGWSGARLSSTSRVYFCHEVSHDWLFPRVRAVVHHGGAGTTAAGLRCGKPTLIIPFAGDQSFWGYRVWQAGCGPKPIPRDRLTVERLTRGLLDLTSQPRYARSAEAIMQGLRQEHGVQTAADLIEKEIAAW